MPLRPRLFTAALLLAVPVANAQDVASPSEAVQAVIGESSMLLFNLAISPPEPEAGPDTVAAYESLTEGVYETSRVAELAYWVLAASGDCGGVEEGLVLKTLEREEIKSLSRASTIEAAAGTDTPLSESYAEAAALERRLATALAAAVQDAQAD